jgi:superfamily II RNA helicase
VAVVEAYESTGVSSAMYPLGEFVGLAADGTWYRFDASRVGAVADVDPVLDAASTDGRWHAPPAPTPNSLRWVRASGGLWRAQGNEEAVEAASRTSITLSSAGGSSAADGEADALAFLHEQRRKIAGTKAELHEMKMFSDMRRAVKKTNRKREKLKKLEERAKKVERRVQEYRAAGWDEFTRVVDILIEEGALEDPVDDLTLAQIEETCAAEDAERAASSRPPRRSIVDEILDDPWEPDDPGPGSKFASALDGLDGLINDSPEDLDVTSPAVDFAAERRRRDARRLARWDVEHGGSDRAEETLRLTPLGECCAKLRGENELWLGVALSSECLGALDPTQIAGLAGALCCDSNRPTSCDYGPSPALSDALADLEPEMAEVMSLQFEGGMTSPVNMSHAVAALVESWASGASWDQVRGDTNLEEGDIARVFRRTSELLAQMPRARELPRGTRKAAEQAAQLVLRPPITDLS